MYSKVDEGFNKKKRMIITAIIISVVLFFLILMLMFYYKTVESNRPKFYLDKNVYTISTAKIEGTDIDKSIVSINKTSYDLYCTIDGKKYYNISSLSQILGYEYKKGEYDPVSEDSDKCYIINEGEYSSFANESNVIKKQFYDTSENSSGTSSSSKKIKEENVEYYNLDDKVIKLENNLYAPEQAIEIGFNVQINVESNNLTMYSLSYLSEVYSNYATGKNYDSISDEFKNKRALVNDLIVVVEDGKYGIYSSDSDSEVISTKYDSIEYIENIGQFIGSYSGKYGMLSPESEKPTIPIEYDSIELIDSKEMLYLVSKNSKYGVISGTGKIIVPIEYDEIGLDNLKDFENQNFESKYILLDKFIVVKENNSYGLYSKDGQQVRESVYTNFGCKNAKNVVKSQDNGIEFFNTLIVEATNGEVTTKGIVFELNEKYGVIGENGEVIIPSDWDAIFYTKSGETKEYYAASSETGVVSQIVDLIKFSNINNNQNNQNTNSDQTNNDNQNTDNEQNNNNDNQENNDSSDNQNNNNNDNNTNNSYQENN